MNGARNLIGRINRLEQTLGALPCNCPDGTDGRSDLSTLTDQELQQLKTALQTVEQAGPTNTRSPDSARAPAQTRTDFENRCSIH